MNQEILIKTSVVPCLIVVWKNSHFKIKCASEMSQLNTIQSPKFGNIINLLQLITVK